MDKKGAFTTINVPGAFHTQAHGINALGKIVGAFTILRGYMAFRQLVDLGSEQSIVGPDRRGNYANDHKGTFES
jgi:hypothetical protein